MNKTKIEWTDYTWNPITGCLHRCKYCYARKKAENPFYKKAFPYKFEPHFYEQRLIEPVKLKNPSKIFTVSMGDMFGEWVPDDWIIPIFQVMNLCKQHIFQILTKNPNRINRVISGDLFTPNIWLGTSVEDSNGLQRIADLQKVPQFKKFVSFEPLLGKIDYDLSGIDWVIIGAQTNPLIIPKYEWVKSICYNADLNNIPVFFKNSMFSCPESIFQMFRQEFPKTSDCRMSMEEQWIVAFIGESAKSDCKESR